MPDNDKEFPFFDQLKPKEQQLVDAYLAEEMGGPGQLKRVAARTGLAYNWVRQKVVTVRLKMGIESRRALLTEQSELFVRAAFDQSMPIIDRNGRMARLSLIIDDEDEPTPNRMRAIEMLGRMEGDFVERVQHEDVTAPKVSPIGLARRIEQLTGKAEPEQEAKPPQHDPFK